MIDTILLVLAAICFAAAAFNVKIGSAQPTALGLLFWVLAALIP